ncbi:uncharacterized protein [Littorina saxatilis]|uniref:uncharacterized protein n=1 Tax=Littorina saxatilis TaxID=31220 RepID=UPI0038B5251E
METPASVREALRPSDWVTSIDLTDAYFHILMHRSDRKWLRFLWGDRVFQFRALPFGLSLAPWIFTMIVRQLCALVRQKGIRLRVYLDDWLILSQQESLCGQHTQIVLQTARDLGFFVNQGKSDLVPSQEFTYLGMVFDTLAWTVRPAQRRIDKLQDLGWGAHLEGNTASGLWDRAQRSLHINILELEAVRLGLMEFVALLRGKQVLIHTDNTTVAAYLNKQGGTRSLVLSNRACEILAWAFLQGIVISAKYLPGCLNILADSLSRTSQILHSEWTIAHQALRRMWTQVDKPLVDLFATRFSRRLPVFVSPVPDPEAWEVNAMEIDWKDLVAYAFPPIPLLSKVLRKADLEKPRLVLIAPLWPSQAWFPDLLRLADGPPIPLDLREGELLQPRSGIPHRDPHLLALHAWVLSGER